MILVLLTDFSEAAANAAHYVAAMSGQLPVDKVVLYHSLEPAHLATELPLAGRHHLYEESMQKLEQLRIVFESHLPPGTPVSILADERTLEVATPKIARENHAELLVMGSRPRRGIAEALYEGMAGLIASADPVPVLIIPAGLQFSRIRNIAFASDLEPDANRIPVKQIGRFKALLQARLFVIHTYDGEDIPAAGRIAPKQQALYALLDDQESEIHYLPKKHVAEAIIRLTWQHEIHLVITVPGTHSFPGSLFHSDISRSLISRSNIPVLILHPEP